MLAISNRRQASLTAGAAVMRRDHRGPSTGLGDRPIFIRTAAASGLASLLRTMSLISDSLTQETLALNVFAELIIATAEGQREK